MPKKLYKDVRSLVGAGVTIGVGSAVVAGMGAPAGVTGALGTAGGMLRPVATGVMGMHTLRIVNERFRTRNRMRKRIHNRRRFY